MAKSSYALVQKVRYRVTLEVTLLNEFDYNLIKWNKLLDLQSGENVKVEVNEYNTFLPQTMQTCICYIITLDIVALEDLDPNQIDWKKFISSTTKKNSIMDFKSYVEVLDAPYSW